jgi:hypothetical protein
VKTYATAAAAALAGGAVIVAGAVKVATSTPFLVWSGEGNISLDDGAGAETYIGIGHRGLINATGSRIGGQEDGIELVLSDVDPDTAAIINAGDARGARVTIWRLLFDVSGTQLLDAQVFERGRVDVVRRRKTPGGSATFTAYVETAARGLGRKTGRMTSDADQRMISATDNSLTQVTVAGELTLAWGGKPPSRAGQALPGVGGVGGPSGAFVADSLNQSLL